MATTLQALLLTLPRLLRSSMSLQAEVLVLRHQVLVLQRQVGGRRVALQRSDRLLWVWLSRERRELGRVVAIPEVGGLHHRYERRAA